MEKLKLSCIRPVCDLKAIERKINEAADEFDQIDNNFTLDNERMTQHEETLNLHSDRLTAAENTNKDHNTRLDALEEGLANIEIPEAPEAEFLPHVVTIGGVEIYVDDSPYTLTYDPNDYEIIYGYISGRLCVTRLRGNVGSTQSLEFTTSKYVNGEFTLIYMRLTLGADFRTLTKSVCATVTISAAGVVTVNKAATGISVGRFYGIPKNKEAASRGEEFEEVGGGPRT